MVTDIYKGYDLVIGTDNTIVFFRQPRWKQRVKTLIQNLAIKLMELNDKVFDVELDSEISWKDEIRWAIDPLLSCVFNYGYEGSVEEIELLLVHASTGDLHPYEWDLDRRLHSIFNALLRFYGYPTRPYIGVRQRSSVI